MLSQASSKVKGLGEGGNTRLGKVDSGNGLRGEFLWGHKMFVECPQRAGDSQQISRPFLLPDVATDNPSHKNAYIIFHKTLSPQRLGIQNFQVDPTKKFTHLDKQKA